MPGKLSLWLAVWVLGLRAQTPSVIEGTVTNSLTHAPVAGAKVTIDNQGIADTSGILQIGGSQSAVTDSTGHFRIENLKPGPHTATVNSSGFVMAHKRLTGDNLKIEIDPFAKLSGRLTDATEQAVAGARVELILASGLGGNMVETDKEGRFHFDSMQPGRYVLCARVPLKLDPPKPRDGERMGWIRTCYPGVTEREDAARIVLSPGMEMAGEDIQLRAVPVHRVRGVVLDAKGEPAAGATVHGVATYESSFQLTGEARTVKTGEDGAFEFTDLHDGKWNIYTENGSTHALVDCRDIDSLQIRAVPPFDIPVVVECDRCRKDNAPILMGPSGGGPGIPQKASNGDGTFRFTKVQMGRYRVISFGAQPGYYLASLQLGEQDVLGQDFDTAPGMPPLKVVYRNDGGTVRGTVEHCGGATVVLEPPQDALIAGRLVLSTSCGEGGRFEFQNVRPGDYYLFAFDRVEFLRLYNAAYVRGIANKGVAVSVRAKEIATADAKVTEWAEW